MTRTTSADDTARAGDASPSPHDRPDPIVAQQSQQTRTSQQTQTTRQSQRDREARIHANAADLALAANASRTGMGRTAATFLIMAVALLIMTIVSASLGQLVIPFDQVIGSVLNKIGIHWLNGPSRSFGNEALWNVRFPRIAMAIVVGAALGVAGAVMQGVFGNPLAEPGTVGVSSGAAVGASCSILMGWTFLGSFTTPFLAFVCGLGTTMLVYVLARRGGRTEVVTLILTGVAVNAIAGALIAFFTFAAPTSARDQIVFWQMGSFNGSRWQQVALVTPLCVVGMIIVQCMARRLDLLSLGEKSARHLGVNVERLRFVCMIAVALLVSSAVAFSGIISFVGLVVPHLLRMIIGPRHRALLPASALGGALLLTIADFAARTTIAFADLPIGMLTSLVGGPFFFWLLRRSRSKSGGWA
ncbi:hemin ABC transporter permease [Bifidobacterium sp. UTCIF-39]|uniref:FecCD family ABC transporter permease n=1 Tax=Bifidobacterium sp. UTCIF-39 TaxID=1465359 RepID=UPI0015E2ADC4|nr:iron ABC transporter permease [Bifidobacterium sp. UTCIF-39]TPF96766.1 hemin ABC transporter permease [Bifidobacterium sp. UTCIF-39]